MRATSARFLTVLAIALAACTGGREPSPPRSPPPPPPPIVAPTAPAEPAAPALIDVFRQTEGAEERRALIDRIREELGAPGLVRALDAVATEPPERAWFELAAIFKHLQELADPRTADGLVRWVEAAPRHPHFQGEVGVRLAEIGDLRGAKYLAERLRHEPSQVYKTDHVWEVGEGGHLARTDLPRVVAARMLADLAMIHPEAGAELLATAEDAVLSWANDRPQPHVNALRFLAAAGSTKALPDLRAWAFPRDPLPRPGAQPPFPSAFETAQVALRYLGMRKDGPSFDALVKQLGRKPDRKLVITQQALMDGGLAMLGMALRALGYGAAQGLAQWGDARARKPLVDLIEDETWHEEVRVSACEALAWCADDRTITDVTRKVEKLAPSKKPEHQFLAACYASTLATRGAKASVPALVPLLGSAASGTVRIALARAIGAAGADAASVARIQALLQDPAARGAAAFALLLGGTKDAAASVAAATATLGEPALQALTDAYALALGPWSDAALESGAIFRWVENAEAVTAPWARERLAVQLEGLRFDNGPHSMTRAIMRYRLRQIAKSGQSADKKSAVATLAMMKERGTLAALAEEPGETGELARAWLADR